MIDSHCHIGFDELKENLDSIIQNAVDAGVEKMLTVACGKENLSDLYSILDKYDNVYGSFGIHPNEGNDIMEFDELFKIIQSHPKIIAVGETGLDYYYNDTPKDKQISNFENHIQVAKELKLPLIVHTRDAENDTINCLMAGAADGKLKGVLHCFTGSSKLAQAALDLGFYISASGIITFKKTTNTNKYQSDLAETFINYPNNKLLIETDSPYLAPVPMRGKKNEPAYLPYTLHKLAELKGISTDQMEQITTQNFYNLFFEGKLS